MCTCAFVSDAVLLICDENSYISRSAREKVSWVCYNALFKTITIVFYVGLL